MLFFGQSMSSLFSQDLFQKHHPSVETYNKIINNVDDLEISKIQSLLEFGLFKSFNTILEKGIPTLPAIRPCNSSDWSIFSRKRGILAFEHKIGLHRSPKCILEFGSVKSFANGVFHLLRSLSYKHSGSDIFRLENQKITQQFEFLNKNQLNLNFSQMRLHSCRYASDDDDLK